MKQTIIILFILTILSCSNNSHRHDGNKYDRKQDVTSDQIHQTSGDNNAKGKDPQIGSGIIPNETIIANDLIGRKITECRDNGYFDNDWVWTIENGEILDFKILNQVVDTDYCTFYVEMILKAVTRPIKYKATVQVDYTKTNNRWVISMVQSKGVDVVKTGRYDNCISTKIGDDGWGGVDCLKIKNNTDVPLFVGGLFRTSYSDAWRKFSAVVNGLEVIGIGGTFGGGSVVDYEIHWVEQY
ncbi:MAG: hypothetical protein IJK92_05800 [Bacteroidales bacterium]|nr:hypothetical protein [Bacteroidales bacterium]